MFQVLSVMHCVNDWYLNFNCCSSEQQPLKTVGKMEFWNWNNLAILRGEFTFDLTGRSFTFLSTHLSSWISICLVFLWWKYSFKMVHFVHSYVWCARWLRYWTHAELGSVHCNMDWCWDILWVSLQKGCLKWTKGYLCIRCNQVSCNKLIPTSWSLIKQHFYYRCTLMDAKHTWFNCSKISICETWSSRMSHMSALVQNEF